MRHRTIALSFLASLGIAASGLALGQQTSPSPPDSWRMPYQSGFWGHTGLSFGQAKLADSCIAGFRCDDKDQTFRLYAGGRFNNAVGLEAGLMNMGRFDRGGGQTDGYGLDLALVAGVPFGTNSAVFGKLGAIYARTEVEGPGLRAGTEQGWGPRFGIGAQFGLTPQWAARLDIDRYRMPLEGGKEDLDTITVGAQYTFR
ncbi:MAG: porin family protein [Burkholderiales bacterium]